MPRRSTPWSRSTASTSINFWPGAEERLERPLSNFIDVNPFVADENFGDAAIGWVMGRMAGTMAQNRSSAIACRLHDRARHRGGRQGQGHLQGRKNKKTTLNSIFALPADIEGNGDKVFAVQLALYQKYTRAIEAVAKDNNVKTAYFLQPAPAWGKTLTEEERREAGGNLAYPDLYRRWSRA